MGLFAPRVLSCRCAGFGGDGPTAIISGKNTNICKYRLVQQRAIPATDPGVPTASFGYGSRTEYESGT